VTFYFDTSALVKLFHEEEGSETVMRIINSNDSEIWISELARIEFLSAVFRRYRNKEIGDQELKVAIDGFEEQLNSFSVEPLGQAIVREAESLPKKYGKTKGLRALDALQFGTFSLISEEDWLFVTTDELLLEVVQDSGCKAMDPREKRN